MSIEIKIHEGTGRLTGVSLCKSCTHATLWIDQQGEHLSCRALNFPTPAPKSIVRECGSYYNKTLPSLHDFHMSAWLLRTEKNGRVIGFSPPKHSDIEGQPPSGI